MSDSCYGVLVNVIFYIAGRNKFCRGTLKLWCGKKYVIEMLAIYTAWYCWKICGSSCRICFAVTAFWWRSPLLLMIWEQQCHHGWWVKLIRLNALIGSWGTFTVSGPVNWSSLPPLPHVPSSVSWLFRRQLKTFRFPLRRWDVHCICRWTELIGVRLLCFDQRQRTVVRWTLWVF